MQIRQHALIEALISAKISINWLVSNRLVFQKVDWTSHSCLHEILETSQLKQAFPNAISHLKGVYQRVLDAEKSRFQKWIQSGYDSVYFFDADYPEDLFRAVDPPLRLWLMGNRNALKHPNKVTIIGTRAPSPYGDMVTRHVAQTWSFDQIAIVSGLAKGIDGLAHQYALTQGGLCIAIIGNGFNAIYPKCHQKLASEIARQGAILSEYHPDEQPLPYHFPRRNRLLSSLSNAVVVIESKQKSGTSITVQHALQQGVPVLAVPGNIYAPQSKGTNLLIQEGADPLLSPSDLYPYLKEPPLIQSRATHSDQKILGSNGLNQAAIRCIRILLSGPLSLDELKHVMKLPDKIFYPLLTELECLDYIKVQNQTCSVGHRSLNLIES